MATTERGNNQRAIERWRLFAAVPVTDEVQEAIARVQRGLATRGWPVRWVKPELTHITVKFFGDTEVGGVGELRRRLAIVAGRARSTTLETSGIGAFPSVARPRVIWVGLAGAVKHLERLAEDVDAVSGGTRASPGDKPFRAHITLGRVRDDARRIDDFQEALRDYGSPPLDVPIDRLQLVRSVLGPGGPTYTTVAEWPLGRPEPDEHG